MTFGVLLACFLVAAWLSWQRFWSRSGLMAPQTRRNKHLILPMPALVFWGDIGMNAMIAIGFFCVDPVLGWLGYSEIFRTKVSIITITVTIFALQGLKVAGQNYLRRFNTAEAAQELARAERLRALGFEHP